MTLFMTQFGVPEPTRTIAGLDETVILPAGINKQPIAKIHIANVTGNAVTFDLSVLDDAAVFYLAKGDTVPANDWIELRDEVLGIGEILRIKAGTAGALHVSVLSALTER